MTGSTQKTDSSDTAVRGDDRTTSTRVALERAARAQLELAEHDDGLRKASKKKGKGGNDGSARGGAAQSEASETAERDGDGDGRRGGLTAQAADVAERATDVVAGAAGALEQKADDAAARHPVADTTHDSETDSAPGSTTARTRRGRATGSRTTTRRSTPGTTSRATPEATAPSSDVDEAGQGVFTVDA